MARTPLVVLDEAGGSVLAEATPTTDPVTPDDDRTMVKTPQSVSAQSPAHTSHPTVPTRVEPEVQAPRTISGGGLLAVVGLLLVALVGALVWALGIRPSGGSGGDSPTPTTVVQTDGGAPIIDLPEQPALDGRSEPGGVVFTWNYAGVRTGDFYRLRVAASEVELGEAAVTTVKEGTYRVPAASGSLVCAQVAVSRAQGTAGPYSNAKCLSAG